MASYLAASSLAAAAGWIGGRTSAALLGAHVLAAAVVAAFVVRRAEGVVVDWLPIIAIPLLYHELPNILLSGQSHDALVQGWEAHWFGLSPAHTAAARWPYPALSELLHAAYLSYYAIIVVPPLVLYLKGERERFERTMAGLMTAFALCFVIFIAFPVAGPRYEWLAPPGVYDGPVRRFVLRVLESGSSRGTAFPSSHVAVAAAQSAMVLGWSRKFGLGLSVLTVLLAMGAVYGGFHYGVDAVAGGIVGCAVGTVFSFSFANRDEPAAAGVAEAEVGLAVE